MAAIDVDLALLDDRLHDYQRRSVRHLWEHDRAGLFLEVGLGKSAVVLSALTEDHLPALVIAPKRVSELSWPDELESWRPDLSYSIATGTKARRQAAINEHSDVTLLGVANLADAPVGQYRTIVLDELSMWKSRSSKRWMTTRRLVKPAKYVWGLTGTPAPNGLMDLWAQIYLLDQGERLDTALTRFRDRYFTAVSRLPGTHVVTEWRLREGAKEQIEGKISDICLSMRQEDYLELPPITVNPIHVKLSAKTLRVYREMKETLTYDRHSAATQAVASIKLSQITSGFLYADIDDPNSELTELHNEKTAAAREVVDGTGSPVLIFYRFKHELYRLEKEFPEAVNIKEDGAVDRWNRGEIPVLLAHPASAGHGLNLQHGGHTIIWISLSWPPELWTQANGRLARQGQTKPVMVHTIQAQGTIDDRIAQVLARKISLQDAVMQELG